MVLKNLLNGDFPQAIMSWGKWVALIASVGVIFNYGSQFGSVANAVEDIQKTVSRHESILSKINSENWSRNEQKQYDVSIDKRLSYMEARLDAIYNILLRERK